ncbi:hypothetical protein AAMO2058_001140100 [Amorphochlora amoebiformis]
MYRLTRRIITFSRRVQRFSSSRKPRVNGAIGQSVLLAGGLLGGLAIGYGAWNNKKAPPTFIPVEGERQRDEWKKVLTKCIPAIVTIKVSTTRAFDTELPGFGQATGFIVDKERGIILTNRHVVGSGPVTANAIFQNHEEVALKAIYRDPVHDFGFFQFDPSKIRHMQLHEIPLQPDNAHIGLEIRVVGNDAGEKLSILQGTLARLDRPAPSYGSMSFNDFNTFYYQAASSTSGGSSGSPVLDITGSAVALNAAGKVGAASSFYLPLDRVLRALKLIQNGKAVTRGTLQTTFRYAAFDELRRLGLPDELEGAVRASSKHSTDRIEGMLVVSRTLKGGPGYGKLMPGDILYKLNGDLTTKFVPLEATLDDNVNKTSEFIVVRNQRIVNVDVPVGDLHDITPKTLLEIGGGMFNNLSYHQARNHNISLDSPGVYVAVAGYWLGKCGAVSGTIIRAVNGIPTPNVTALEKVLADVPDNKKIALRISHVTQPLQEAIVIPRLDRKWNQMVRRVRCDKTGKWNAVVIKAPPQKPEKSQALAVSSPFVPGNNKVEKSISNSLVWVSFFMPMLVDGIHTNFYQGTGLICDAEKGLVVVDRNTVPTTLGDVTLNFGGAIDIAGQVVCIHPVHNLAVIRYDPKLLKDIPVKEAKLTSLDEPEFTKYWSNVERKDQKVHVVGLGGSAEGQRLVSKVGKRSLTQQAYFPIPHLPRYQEQNLNLLSVKGINTAVGSTEAQDGVIINSESLDVMGYWASFYVQVENRHHQAFYGIPGYIVKETVELARSKLENKDTPMRSLGVELDRVSLARARELGMTTDYIKKSIRFARERGMWPPTVLDINRRWGGSDALNKLQDGDILVAMDGKDVNDFRGSEKIAMNSAGNVNCTIFRDRKKMDVEVETVEINKRLKDDRILLFAGATLQKPPFAVSHLCGIPDNGVYVSSFLKGSPSERYRLHSTHRIVEVDGKATPDLDTFLAGVKNKEHGTSIRMKVKSLTGHERMITLKLDTMYWPTERIEQNEAGVWVRNSV